MRGSLVWDIIMCFFVPGKAGRTKLKLRGGLSRDWSLKRCTI